jgi:phosphohistidine phosphatase
MNLYIVRHAIAEQPGTQPDSQRPLTDKGRKKLRRIARGLNALEVRLNLILTSPYTRARETADILADAFRLIDDKIIESEHLTPSGFADQLIEEVNASYREMESIALVGHEPFLSDLISVLLTGTPDLDVNFKKGGVCALTIENLHYGRCATLEWLLTPAQLALIG